MARPKVFGRDIPPQKWHVVVIDKEATASKAKKLPPKGGKGKGNEPIVVPPKEASSNSEGVYETQLTTSDREGDSQDSQASISEPKDDQLLQSWQAELRSKAHHDPSRILELTPPASTSVTLPAQTVVPAPPVQDPPP